MSISYRRLIKPKSIEFHFEVIVLVLDNEKEILSLTKIFVIVIVNRKKTGREGSIICRFSIITFVWFDLEIGMVTQMGSSMFLWGGGQPRTPSQELRNPNDNIGFGRVIRVKIY